MLEIPSGPAAAPETRSPSKTPVRRGRLRSGLLVAAALAAAAGATAHLLPRAEAHFAAHGPPGAEALSAPMEVRGRVTERLDAGRYAYVHVAEEGGADRWIVSIRPKVAPGDRVVARAAARAGDFRSKRLGRTFEELYFGSIEPAR